MLSAGIAEVDASEAMHVRSDIDDPRRRAGQQQVEQLEAEQKIGEMIEGPGSFETVAGEGVLSKVGAGIVDEQIEALVIGPHRLGQAQYVLTQAQIRQQHVQALVAASRRDHLAGLTGPIPW